MKAKGWAVSDVGLKRDHNEDSFLCSDALGLYAVADGMGGHLGGERASRMAVELLEQEVAKLWDKSPNAAGVAAALKEATVRAAEAIHLCGQDDDEHAGMGTTLTSGLFHGGHVTICHVGDSRAYLYRDGHARQITEDHSWIAEQVRAGLISPDDAMVSRFKNVITRSVGFEPMVTPDILTLPVEAGDAYIFCSDGLSNYLLADEMARILTAHFYRDAARVLVDMANERGGEDNITCVVVYVGNAP